MPPELREAIYKEALLQARLVQIEAKEINRLTTLLRVCSQIRSEAWHIFFDANKFEVSNLHTKFFLKFTEHVSGATLRRIPSIKVTLRIPIEIQALAIQFLSPGLHLYPHNYDSLRTMLQPREMSIYFAVTTLAWRLRRQEMIENLTLPDPIWLYPPQDAMGRLEREMKQWMGQIFVRGLYDDHYALAEQAMSDMVRRGEV